MTGHLQIFPLFGRQVRGQGQFGHAEDPDHGGTDLMGDVGQKMAFGLVRGLGRLPGAGQVGLDFATGG